MQDEIVEVDTSATYLETREYHSFSVIPRTPVIGGTIEGGDFNHIDDQFADDLRDALWTYGVLFGKGRHLSFDAMKRVAYVFGDQLEKHSFAYTLEDQGHPEVTVIERLPEDGDKKSTTDIWHHDVTARQHPNIMSILQAEACPFGADTMWSSTTEAYRLLPEALKRLFGELQVEHDSLYLALRHDFGGGQITPEKLAMLQESSIHPAVIKHHATGEPCLFVGNGYVKRIKGYTADASELLIKLANQYPVIPELQVRHEWEPGDFAIWDNFATCHYGVSGNIGNELRRLYRVSAWSETVKPTAYC